MTPGGPRGDRWGEALTGRGAAEGPVSALHWPALLGLRVLPGPSWASVFPSVTRQQQEPYERCEGASAPSTSCLVPPSPPRVLGAAPQVLPPDSASAWSWQGFSSWGLPSPPPKMRGHSCCGAGHRVLWALRSSDWQA